MVVVLDDEDDADVVGDVGVGVVVVSVGDVCAHDGVRIFRFITPAESPSLLL